MKCKVCGEDYPEDEMSDEHLCLNCVCSILQVGDDIDLLGEEEFLLQ
jgi:hypothetical protein